jgi:hypothetical protein
MILNDIYTLIQESLETTTQRVDIITDDGTLHSYWNNENNSDMDKIIKNASIILKKDFNKQSIELTIVNPKTISAITSVINNKFKGKRISALTFVDVDYNGKVLDNDIGKLEEGNSNCYVQIFVDDGKYFYFPFYNLVDDKDEYIESHFEEAFLKKYKRFNGQQERIVNPKMIQDVLRMKYEEWDFMMKGDFYLTNKKIREDKKLISTMTEAIQLSKKTKPLMIIFSCD